MDSGHRRQFAEKYQDLWGAISTGEWDEWNRRLAYMDLPAALEALSGIFSTQERRMRPTWRAFAQVYHDSKAKTANQQAGSGAAMASGEHSMSFREYIGWCRSRPHGEVQRNADGSEIRRHRTGEPLTYGQTLAQLEDDGVLDLLGLGSVEVPF